MLQVNDHERLMTRARMSLLDNFPFFGSLALRLAIKAAPSCKTLSVDGRTIRYNPDYVLKLTFKQVVGVLGHEVLHCALGHHARLGGRDFKTFNRAADYAINPLILKAGMELPPGGLIDPKFDGKAAEDIYSVLWAEKLRKQKERQENPEGGLTGPGGEGDEGDEADSEDGDSDKPTRKGKGKSKGKKSDKSKDEADGDGEADADDESDDTSDDDAGDSDGDANDDDDGAQSKGGGDSDSDDSKPDGQGSNNGTGDGDSDDDKNDDVGGTGVFHEPEGEDGQPIASKEELDDMAREWQIAASQAMMAAKKVGNAPGNMIEVLEKARQPQVDWHEQLRRFFQTSAKQDYSWTPPNRRHVAAGLYLPSLTSEGLGEIVVAVDTSISMNTPALQIGTDEVNGIAADLLPERIHVIYCDTRVHRVETFESGDYPIKVNAVGRGGTAFSPVFKKVEEMGIEPACLIFFTDLECYDYGPTPSYPVLWACTSPMNVGRWKPPFGEVIAIPEFNGDK